MKRCHSPRTRPAQIVWRLNELGGVHIAENLAAVK